ncbi:MAG: ribosome recycling factor domain-containing protein [Linnemannia elongata]|nr:MAG: ribosome recycling factor domain-containing protein [Linnemannia elongata]
MQRATSTLLSATRRIASSNVNAAWSMSTRQSTPLLLKANNTVPLAKSMAMVLNASTCQQLRGYASKKDAKKGGKSGKGGKKGGDDDEEDDRKGKGKSSGGSAPSGEMSFDLLDLEKKMGQCLERLKKDFMTMRAGTANPAILDPVSVKVENKMVPLRDLAQVSIKDAKTLMVNVNDVELTGAIEKAIREAGLNLNPIADNKAVRVPVPKPTKEFRESLTKLAAASTEKAKTIIRKLRQDGMKELKKDLKAGMSEDENYGLEKKAQTLHDKYIKDAEEALKVKTKEIMAN